MGLASGMALGLVAGLALGLASGLVAGFALGLALGLGILHVSLEAAMKRGAWILTLVAAAAVIVAVAWRSQTTTAPAKPSAVAGPSKPAPVASPPDKLAPAKAPAAPPPLRLYPGSEALAAQLNAPDGDAAQDVTTLHRLLQQYQRALHHRQGTPVGDDIDLARALTGRNPMRQVFLPPGHPALATNGHLTDRWGTPYHLHPRGNGAYEVRSAGPDRQLYTADDLVANPPRQGP